MIRYRVGRLHIAKRLRVGRDQLQPVSDALRTGPVRDDSITVHQALSTDLTISKLGTTLTMAGVGVGAELQDKADILVAEIVGTLLLSESQLDYIEGARTRLLKPGGVIIPAAGTQFITLIEMPALETVSSVSSYHGIDLSAFTRLRCE